MSTDPTTHTYVDGFLLPVPTKNLELYRQVASQAAHIWRDHGAIHYEECVLDDPTVPEMRSFVDLAGAGPEDSVVLAWAVFPSREARDAANQKIMADPRIAGMAEQAKGLFDCHRMAYGGFRSIVRAS